MIPGAHSTRFARSRRLVQGCVILATAAAAESALADGRELARTEPGTLGVELAGTFLLAAGAQQLPVPTRCSWCMPTAFDILLHSPAPAESRDAIAATSHLLSFILLPLGGVTSVVALPLFEGGSGRHAAENMVILTEVALVNFAVTLAAKKMVARQRPAFHYRRAGATEFSRTRVEQNLSFFSGDTSVAFSTASGAATIAFMRGYGSAPYVTAGGAVLAVATGAMRVAADVHWPTDVLTGAFVGTAVGIAIPLLLHPRSSPSRANGQSSYRLSEPLDAPALFTFGGAF